NSVAGVPVSPVDHVSQGGYHLTDREFRLLRIAKRDFALDDPRLKLQRRVKVVVDHRYPITEADRFMAPAFSLFQVNHAYFVVNLRRFAPLTFLPSKAQQLFRVLDVFEHEGVEPMDRTAPQPPSCQGFRVSDPFLAERLVNGVP